MKVCLFGTADLTKPRTRIMLGGLYHRDVVVCECLVNPWEGVEDKSQIRGIFNKIRIVTKYLLAYPLLIWRYLRAPRHDIAFVAYMGHLDVLVLWPFAKMRGATIAWDAFLSLYDTVVDDRALVKAGGIRAGILWAFEALVCAAAGLIVLDTKAHADYFRERYHLRDEKVASVWVGAETEIFTPKTKAARGDKFNVLFYGQYIPLHGIAHILDAARHIDDPAINWTIIGRGQETARLRQADAPPSVRFVDWIDYERLPDEIAAADVCLGIFGTSAKAARVIPNKVFQILACGAPLITMRSPAIREILSPEMQGVWLVAPGSGAAIAEAVRSAQRWHDTRDHETVLYPAIRPAITPQAVADKLIGELQKLS